ncbi:MAG: DUF4294 domain-containing protein [Bacteroidetes bacterium HGW-Bacteroidetes-8]|jgi:hypothetical protein|nr:MAG: DUF4294 domain-containing protein [Bacteroidetes bacterium HGW-Bacteroidetes-8]
MRRCTLYTLILIPVLFLQSSLFSQERGYSVGYKVEGRDTIYYMNLSEVYLFSWDNKRKKDKEWREFYRLVYNFRKTYPYALIAKEKINEADSILASQNFNKREREKYIQQFELKLFNEFEKPLRKMTFSQGKLLLKLIDREIGQSSYFIIKNYRGGAAAGFWQGIAKIFGSDMKKPYDRFGDDKLTEELVQMYKKGTFEYLYFSIF